MTTAPLEPLIESGSRTVALLRALARTPAFPETAAILELSRDPTKWLSQLLDPLSRWPEPGETDQPVDGPAGSARSKRLEPLGLVPGVERLAAGRGEGVAGRTAAVPDARMPETPADDPGQRRSEEERRSGSAARRQGLRPESERTRDAAGIVEPSAAAAIGAEAMAPSDAEELWRTAPGRSILGAIEALNLAPPKGRTARAPAAGRDALRRTHRAEDRQGAAGARRLGPARAAEVKDRQSETLAPERLEAKSATANDLTPNPSEAESPAGAEPGTGDLARQAAEADPPTSGSGATRLVRSAHGIGAILGKNLATAAAPHSPDPVASLVDAPRAPNVAGTANSVEVRPDEPMAAGFPGAAPVPLEGAPPAREDDGRSDDPAPRAADTEAILEELADRLEFDFIRTYGTSGH